MSVVIASMNRCERVLPTIERLLALPEQPPIILVDNGSSDGTVDAVRAAFPTVEVTALPVNIGAPARNLGVARATTPFVAFADDDSWWAPGSLDRAADVLDTHAAVALVAARVLVGPRERLDEVSAAMAASPLPDSGPGPGVLGFLACGAVVRREAFLSVGGFDDLLFFVGEEQLLAIDLVSAGWRLAYVDDVVAHHHPGAGDANRDGRRRRQLRNDLLTDIMRRPARIVVRRVVEVARAAGADPVARGALIETATRLPAAVRRRHVVSRRVERQLRAVDGR